MQRLIEPSRGNLDIRLLAQVGQEPLIRFHKTVAAIVTPWRKRRVPLTLRECCKRLEAKGIRTYRGRAFSPSRLTTILKQISQIQKNKKRC
jgi:hypothetical protein